MAAILITVLLAAAPAPAAPPRVVRSLPLPAGFVGHLAYDPASGRLWLLSFGPPASTTGPSRLYELDPATGAVLARTELPLQGSFAAPAVVAGRLYVGVYWESRIYEISTAKDSFGRIAGVVAVPELAALGLGGDGHARYPFLEFAGLAPAPDGSLLIQASQAGELIALDRASGAVLRRVPTVQGLGGVTAAPGAGGRPLLIANRDAENVAVVDKVMRFELRPARQPVATKRSRWGAFAARPEPKRLRWLLLDAGTGEVLSSAEVADSPAYAASTAFVRREEAPGAPFGRFTLLALGGGGLLTLEWTPGPGEGDRGREGQAQANDREP